MADRNTFFFVRTDIVLVLVDMTRIIMQALKEDSLLVVSSKKSFLDKCRLPVGIKLLVSAGHSDSDLIKVSESLKRLASELLL